MAKMKELPFWAIKLKRFRLSKGLNQQDLADICKLSLASITSYEQGLRKPREKTMQIMKEKTGLDIYEVFFNSELEDVKNAK